MNTILHIHTHTNTLFKKCRTLTAVLHSLAPRFGFRRGHLLELREGCALFKNSWQKVMLGGHCQYLTEHNPSAWIGHAARGQKRQKRRKYLFHSYHFNWGLLKMKDTENREFAKNKKQNRSCFLLRSSVINEKGLFLPFFLICRRKEMEATHKCSTTY